MILVQNLDYKGIKKTFEEGESSSSYPVLKFQSAISESEIIYSDYKQFGLQDSFVMIGGYLALFTSTAVLFIGVFGWDPLDNEAEGILADQGETGPSRERIKETVRSLMK